MNHGLRALGNHEATALVAATFTFAFAFACERPVPEKASAIATPLDGRTSLVNMTECTGLAGIDNPLPGNVSEPTASFDAHHQYIVYASNEPRQVTLTRFDGAHCTPPVRVNEIELPSSDISHNTPSVFVDGLGYVYVTYGGSSLYAGRGTDPYIRRTMYPHDITSWEPETTMRFQNYAELHGTTMRSGAVLFGASSGGPSAGMIDIVEPGGAYRWPAPRMVITMDTSSGGDPESGQASNRFTKTVFESSRYSPNRLFAVWGWACSTLYETEQCRPYSTDSHEVFFAYSDDGGATWKNLAGTRSVEAPLCSPVHSCEGDLSRGILHHDPDFRITTTRQKEFRAIDEGPDGTIYIAFTRSESHASPPGGLSLLKFRLGGTVEESLVNEDRHTNIAGIRRHGSSLYLWAQTFDGRIFEYTSPNDGASWQRARILERDCGRMHGNANGIAPDLVTFAFSCYNGNETSDVGYYQRTLGEDVSPPLTIDYACRDGVLCDGAPVTGAPDQVVCGTGGRKWRCTSEGWRAEQTDPDCVCGAPTDPAGESERTPCYDGVRCDGSPVIGESGQIVCGTNLQTWACTAGSWVSLGADCTCGS